MGHGQHGAGEYTALDVSIDYPNELGGFVGENGPLLRTSLLLLLILIAAFSYTVITINKQKKLSDLKNDFINNLTHEFKTPIFSISLASGLLRKSEEVKQSARLLKYTELIDNEGKRLKSQVDKILQMALIDSGNFKLDKKQLNLHDLIERVSKNFELIINEQKGQLTLDLSAESASIFADETHLNNIIYNLLDNAVKYTEKRPEIVVSTANTDEGIILIIKDNGIGMSEQVQKFIFDKFYRAGSGDLHNVKGFGLGLSYVKSVIEAHKGGINLNSKKNEGSEFNIYLPLR
nr:HAMP domain-containing sensor histidine kinase [Roseivirga sp. E12]